MKRTKKPCVTSGCSKFAAPRRNYCYACAKANYRARNPERSAYAELKHGAKRRGKDFDLTFEQFQDFAVKTSYFLNKGTRSESLHIDRIDETKGYTIDNIQVLSNAKNCQKYRKFAERINGKPTFTVAIYRPIEQGYCPF